MNRRDFIQNSATAGMSLAMALGAAELQAQGAKPPQEKKTDKPQVRTEDKPKGAPVKCAVIGLNLQGRAILEALSKMGNAPVVGLCDTFSAPVFVKKAQALAPGAAFATDYRKVLEDNSIQAVFVATPSHKHKQIVLDALAAGKHVYCEAPLAVDIEEARAIAKAGMAAKTFLMPGLQFRSNGQHVHVSKFIKGQQSVGKVVYARAQWNKRDTWRQVHPDENRARELNWRLSRSSSLGLIGEVGIHSLDVIQWYLQEFFPKDKILPTAAVGYSNLVLHKDGRDVPDTVSLTLEFPNNVICSYGATLANSFEGTFEMIYGTDSAIMLRDQRAWMFQEAQGQPLGWSVYARKDDYSIGNPALGSGLKVDTGIALVADATKQLALGKQPGLLGADVTKTAIYQAALAFLDSIRANQKPKVGPLEGYRANVIAIKSNEAVLSGQRIEFKPEWFEI